MSFPIRETGLFTFAATKIELNRILDLDKRQFRL